jgi:uncharacterized phiE125 gp8 family phage protein
VCEEMTQRQFMRATWKLSLDRFPGISGDQSYWDASYRQGDYRDLFEYQNILLPRPPLVATGVAITYVDPAGATQTFTDFVADASAEPGRIRPAFGSFWPVTQPTLKAVSITYQSGYLDAASVPEPIKQAILLLFGHWYANREAVTVGVMAANLPMAVDTLLAPYRVWEYR